MENIDLEDLLNKYKTGSCTPEELALLENWYLQWNIENQQFTEDGLLDVNQKMWMAVTEQTRGNKLVELPLWKRIRVAAAVAAIIILSVGIWFFYNDRNVQPYLQADNSPVVPGRSGATLTLANGRKIILTDTVNGKLAEEAGVVITKSAGGPLMYEFKSNTDISGQINTLSTNNGESYQVHLPDGSRVWLNAASSLTYATNLYEDGKRSVKLEGEGYFEVAKDQAHPFIVKSSDQQVEVMGTHFNISAYKDEDVVKTTLIEGSVKVSVLDLHKVLSPGFEAVKSGNNIQVHSIDAELAVAWKDGKFVFENEKIEAIMKMVERWYNVQVVYQGEMPEDVFHGSVSRLENVSQVLDILESTGRIHFKMEGRKIYVSQ
ncbi:FecR family protein [Chitinophaga sp. CF118]|uniref:FecR family protein n=1 Tax=Chitinophaga sp. CF118 TaxID=1884367 RepID=UPI0015A6AAFA|nr:FecR family protein [Chitinophaga sp. CF118]